MISFSGDQRAWAFRRAVGHGACEQTEFIDEISREERAVYFPAALQHDFLNPEILLQTCEHGTKRDLAFAAQKVRFEAELIELRGQETTWAVAGG